jgi:hypothetical protein
MTVLLVLWLQALLSASATWRLWMLTALVVAAGFVVWRVVCRLIEFAERHGAI